MLWLSIAVIVYFVSFIVQIVVQSMAITWSSDSFVAVQYSFPYNAVFGLGIVFTAISIVIFILLILDSLSKAYLWSWISIVVFNTILMTALTSPAVLNSWIQIWDESWSNTSYTMSFQLEKSCCGWENYLDRSIRPCPFAYYSGCKSIIYEWIHTRFNQIFMILILVTGMNAYCISMVLLSEFKYKIKCIWLELEIPFIQPSLYS